MTHVIGTVSLVCMLMLSGCSVWQNGSGLASDLGRKFDNVLREETGGSASANDDELEIANPPAKTIRFDGHEVVLGTTDVTPINANEFRQKLSSLLDEQKYFSATKFVAKNIDAAESLLWGEWANQPSSVPVRFLAQVASRGVQPSASWNSMLAAATDNSAAAKRYHLARTEFTKKLGSKQLSGDGREQLRLAAQQLNQPLATADAMRLMAIAELVGSRRAWAESLLLQAIELAEQNGDHARVSDSWLLLAVHSTQSGEQAVSPAEAWEKAVVSQVRAHADSNRALNVRFWTRADRYRPRNAKWPGVTNRALLGFARPVGCKLSESSPTELILWSAVGKTQLDDGQPQRALVNFKKAESFAKAEDARWLKIEQSQCLAELGQTQAAAALLSDLLNGSNPTLAAASNAVLGSAKLRASAFQQGAQLLNRALQDSTLSWPTRSHAEGDRALAMLIIGDTDSGLKALHGVQSKFEMQGNNVALLQSLGNELRLLEHEGKKQAANNLRRRILEIEQRQDR